MQVLSAVGFVFLGAFGVSLLSAGLVLLFWFIATHTLPLGTKKLPSHVLITGGSKGLGLAIAKLLVSSGVSVTIVARGLLGIDKALNELQSVVPEEKKNSLIIQGFSADASHYEAVLEMLKDVHESPAGSPDWIIANAGSASPGFVMDGIQRSKNEPGRMASQMASNYFPAVNLVQAVLFFANGEKETLRDAPGSVIGVSQEALLKLPEKIVIVGSVLSMMSFIGYSAYAASKHALKGLADGLRSELQPTRTRVHFFAPATMDTPGLIEERKLKPFVTDKIEGTVAVLPPAQAAKALLGGLLRERYTICNDLVGEIVRVVGQGPVPRPNPFLETMSMPLFAGALGIWNWMTDGDIKRHYASVTKGVSWNKDL